MGNGIAEKNAVLKHQRGELSSSAGYVCAGWLHGKCDNTLEVRARETGATELD
jgi:hypothetical protein